MKISKLQTKMFITLGPVESVSWDSVVGDLVMASCCPVGQK